MVELLSPAGNFEKLETAFHFGADAVYLGGKQFGLRAYSDNFEIDEMAKAIKLANTLHKKVYVTVNIFAKNDDFSKLPEYFKALESIGVHGVIISDVGVIAVCKKYAPSLEIHLSTQANTTNKYAVKFWAEQGVKRVVLARELSFNEIDEIKQFVGDSVELETFIHGAMCISYSGRCLLSNYLTFRDSNRGECVQSCRWEYNIAEVSRRDNPLIMQEDERGAYILNSKDLNMLRHIDKMINLGISSFKIEGRMKTSYYVGSVVNAYRRAIDANYNGTLTDTLKDELYAELEKTSHRLFTTAYMLDKADDTQCYDTSKPIQSYDFIASVIEYFPDKKTVLIEQRNRFKVGDILTILSNGDSFNKTLNIESITDENGNEVFDALKVQQKLYIKSKYPLKKYDILTKQKI